jgi:hypothetical protein
MEKDLVLEPAHLRKSSYEKMNRATEYRQPIYVYRVYI